MRKRRIGLAGVAVVLAAAASLAVATSGSAGGAATLKVAWIYPGPHNDGGWAQSHDDGRRYVQKMLGNKVQTTYKENVFSNASVPQIVVVVTRTSASSGPTSGIGFSSSAIRPGSTKIAAAIALAIAILLVRRLAASRRPGPDPSPALERRGAFMRRKGGRAH